MAYLSLRFARSLLASTFTRSNTYAQSLMTSCVNRTVFEIRDEKDFEDKVLKSDLPVVLDFTAFGFKSYATLETTIEKYCDEVHIAKVDCEELPSIADRYGAMECCLPHVVGFKHGLPQGTFDYTCNKDDMENFVKKLIES